MADRKHTHEKHALVLGGPAHEVIGVACQLKDVWGKGSVSVLGGVPVLCGILLESRVGI